MMIIRRMLLVCLVLVLFANASSVEGIRTKRSSLSSLSKEEDLELERQLKILNKPPIRTIHAKISGDIFDCIDIYKQPAFDNPLLKNHKIQLTPNFAVETTTASELPTNVNHAKTELEIQGERCPTGSVPIRRTTKEDLIRAKSIYRPKLQRENLYKANAVTEPKTQPYASVMYYSNVNQDSRIQHQGGKAFLNLHNPNIQSNSFTSTEMSLVRFGDDGDHNAIEVGWTVNPQLYGDHQTRLFTYWTADDGKETGCFNLLCTGFVQTDPTLTLSVAFTNMSVYEGPQFGVMVIIRRNAQTGDWWFMLGDENRRMGYWPKNLFSHLDSALYVAYGGVTWAPNKSSLPPMGNGRFAESSYKKSAYISKMKVIDATGSAVDFDLDKAGTRESHKSLDKCYSLEFFGVASPAMGLSLTYGGPGGYCDIWDQLK